jgi:hypothetical protein
MTYFIYEAERAIKQFLVYAYRILVASRALDYYREMGNRTPLQMSQILSASWTFIYAQESGRQQTSALTWV